MTVAKPVEDDGFKRDKQGRAFINRPDGGPGAVLRKGEETPEETAARWHAEREQKYGPGKGPDKAPKGKKVHSPKPTDAELADMLAQLLTMPSIPMAMVVHCDFCARHFVEEGPRAAAQLVTLSKEAPALRKLLENLHRSWTSISYGAVLTTYLAKPILHHLAPAPIANAVGGFMGVPHRDERPTPRSEPVRPVTGERTPRPDFGRTRPTNAPYATQSPPPPNSATSPSVAEAEPLAL